MTKLLEIQNAPNAFTMNFDIDILKDLQSMYLSDLGPVISNPNNAAILSGGQRFISELDLGESQYFLTSYGKNPLLWVSNNNEKTYQIFKKFYEQLDIDQELNKMIDVEDTIQVYCGFFVVGNKLQKEIWHVDYLEDANAFTLITPLFEVHKEHGDLLYLNHEQKIRKYEYKYGEAVIFGDKFKHSTETYSKSPNMRVMLSMTFGTDKMKYWPILQKTIGGQSKFMYLPCGHERSKCSCGQ